MTPTNILSPITKFFSSASSVASDETREYSQEPKGLSLNDDRTVPECVLSRTNIGAWNSVRSWVDDRCIPESVHSRTNIGAWNQVF
jgi:hypothetical protein